MWVEATGPCGATVRAVKSWQPPALILVVVAIAAAGFALGGPGTGISILGLSLVVLVVTLILRTPPNPIGRNPHPESARRILIVAITPIDHPKAIEEVARQVDLGGLREEAEIRVLALARNTFLERWATDLSRARERAQRDLVISVASLELAGLTAGAGVGDEDLAKAVEDQLVTFDATEIYLVAGTGYLDEKLLSRLETRVQPPVRTIALPRYPGAESGLN